ncbi:MAG: NERD domain-containing protein [Proteobacteria bacterium]|nr:NERD domain-containing protein [Pseudomonadota bacterium]
MKLDNFTYQDWLNNALLPIVIIIVAIVIVVLINRHKLRQHWQERSTRRCLNRIGIDQRSNLRCPDGLGGSFNIDRLVMLHDSILLVSLKPFSGNIYCADNIPEWTQLVGPKSFKFENPLFDLEHQVNAIRIQAPDVPIRGFLFFDHRARFPKGHPEQVLYPANIPENFFGVNCPEPDDTVLKTWDVLVDLPKRL